MLDGGVSIITFIAGFGYAIVAGTTVLFMPVKKITQLHKALMVTARTFTEVQHYVPCRKRINICKTHLALIKNVQNLDKTRWGHLKNFLKYMRLKKDVEDHCNHVENYSALIKAKIMLEEVEGAAREAQGQAEALEGQTNDEDFRDIFQRDEGWTRVKGHPTRNQRSSPTAATLASVDRLNGSVVSLPIPYPVIRPQPRVPPCLPSELESIILEGNLIDLSDIPLVLSQREGILDDLSTDNAESLHELLPLNDESSRLEVVDLLNSLLNSAQTTHSSEAPVSAHTSAPANASTDVNSTLGPSAPRKHRIRTFDHLVDGLEVASGCVSASADILQVIIDVPAS